MSQFELPVGTLDPNVSAIGRHLRIASDFPEAGTAGYILVSQGPDLPALFQPNGSSPPTSHVLATTAGLGAQHTTSGLTAGQVLRATGAATAAFQVLVAGDLPAHLHNMADIVGNLPYAQLPVGGGVWANAGTLSITGGVTTVAGLTSTAAALVSGGANPTGLASATTLTLGGGGGTPNATSVAWGDNTGWKLRFGTIVAAAFTPRLSITDTGEVDVLTGPLVISTDPLVAGDAGEAAPLRVGVTATNKQLVEFGPGGGTTRARIVAASADMYQFRLNVNTAASAFDDAAKPSWFWRMGSGADLFAVDRAPAGSFVFVDLFTVKGTGEVDMITGPLVVGTDPAGSELLRVGGGARITAPLVIISAVASGANITMQAGGRLDTRWQDTAAALDEKIWDISVDGVGGAQTYAFVMRSDAGVAGTQWLRAIRAGNVLSRVELASGSAVGDVVVGIDPAGGQRLRVGGTTNLAGAATVSTGDLTLTTGRLVFSSAVGKILMGATSLAVRDSSGATDIMFLSVNGALALNGTLAELALNPRGGGGNAWELYVQTTTDFRLYHAADQYIFSDTAFTQAGTAKTLGTSGVRWGKLWGADADFSLDVKMDVLGTFDHTGTRFTTGTGPVADDILSWHAGAGKWRPRFLQTAFTSGAAVSQNNTDGTFATFFNSGPGLAGVPAAPTNAPVTTAMYKAVLIDMSAYTLGATQVYVLDYSINGGAYTSGRIITTSAKVIHSNLTIASTYAYKYLIRGGSDTVYSPASGAINPSSSTEANAFGLIVASQIATAYLSSINANIGSITAGQLVSGDGKSIIQLDSSFSIPGTVTQGIFFASANPVPGGITGMYLDFTATGANPLFHHSKIDLNADGTAIFKGLVDITNAPLSLGFGGAFMVLRDSDVAHGMTGAVPTDVLGVIIAGDALAGGMDIGGFADSTVTAMRIEGYNVGAHISTAVMSFAVGKKSGVGTAALAATDCAYDFRNFGTGIMRMFGDGLVVIDQQAGSALEINQIINPTTRRALGVFHGRVDSGATEAVLIDAEWNTAGAPTVLKMTVIDTASAAGSLLVDLQVGGSSKFNVRKDGRVTVVQDLVFTTAASKIIPGATSFSHRNTADSADNLLIADAGDATFRTFIEQNEMSAPSTPAANKTRMYAKDKSGTSALYYKDDAGTEIPIGFTLIDTQTFTATGAGTWTKPAGARLVRVVVIGAGGGGGGGRSGGAGTARCGGTGGGGGAMSERWHDASHLGATEALSVGVGGTAGAAGVGGGDGGAGTAGGDSWFGNAAIGSAKQWAYGGGAGAGGLLATARSGAGGGGWLSAGGAGSSADSIGGAPSGTGLPGDFGGAGATVATTAGNPSVYGGGSGGGSQAGGGVGGAGGVSQFGGGGGGGGGGINTSNVGNNGGVGGDNDVGLNGGGGARNAAGAAGDNFRAGQGGGGGDGNGAGIGANGGAGGAPGGGGGGGGAGNTASGGGAGAAGARGEIRVYSYA